MVARVLTWWTILRICIEERLVYRGDFVLGTLMRFLPIVTQVFLWTAVFQSIGQGTIRGWTRNDVIAYYLLTMVARAFSSMPALASGIAAQIRTGEVKKFLIQPIDMLGYLLAGRLAEWYGRWQAAGFAPVREAWLRRAVGLGEPIEVRLERETLQGRFAALEEDGALILEQPAGGRRRVTVGDVFFRGTERGG